MREAKRNAPRILDRGDIGTIPIPTKFPIMSVVNVWASMHRVLESLIDSYDGHFCSYTTTRPVSRGRRA